MFELDISAAMATLEQGWIVAAFIGGMILGLVFIGWVAVRYLTKPFNTYW